MSCPSVVSFMTRCSSTTHHRQGGCELAQSTKCGLVDVDDVGLWYDVGLSLSRCVTAPKTSYPVTT